jgi:hypothetical protein
MAGILSAELQAAELSVNGNVTSERPRAAYGRDLQRLKMFPQAPGAPRKSPLLRPAARLQE